MWKKALENAKLIISTIMIFASLLVGSWTLITNTFMTKVEAQQLIDEFRIEIAFNKAFRLETKIEKIQEAKKTRELTQGEKREIKRLENQLERIDTQIEFLTSNIFSKE